MSCKLFARLPQSIISQLMKDFKSNYIDYKKITDKDYLYLTYDELKHGLDNETIINKGYLAIIKSRGKLSIERKWPSNLLYEKFDYVILFNLENLAPLSNERDPSIRRNNRHIPITAEENIDRYKRTIFNKRTVVENLVYLIKKYGILFMLKGSYLIDFINHPSFYEFKFTNSLTVPSVINHKKEYEFFEDFQEKLIEILLDKPYDIDYFYFIIKTIPSRIGLYKYFYGGSYYCQTDFRKNDLEIAKELFKQYLDYDNLKEQSSDFTEYEYFRKRNKRYNLLY